ncbi:hypothetical protein MAIT1_03924 [Magnetofaba australis IT-1]|uniref:M50 family peptidase n=2 Tax=Magnetofaba TaxID=1472292 RepID=A0A1Y2K9J2_9PROT|nr:hypothetical protein MAIT1_03924 [Magnetofaba australis IT-1]
MTLLLLALLAFIVRQIPIVSYPFSLMETYFHEMGHGLATLLTGGSITRIELNLNDSGMAYHRGGIGFIVTFCGYFGAALWGTMIYMVASSSSKTSARTMASLLALFVGATTVLYMRDPASWLIGGMLTGLFVIAVKWSHAAIIKPFLQFCGIYVLITAIHSPLNLFHAVGGDGHTLARMTLIPEIVWIAVWIALAFACLAFLWRKAGQELRPTSD